MMSVRYPAFESIDRRVHFELTPQTTPKWHHYWQRAISEIWQEVNVYDFEAAK